MNAGLADAQWSRLVTDSDLAVGFADADRPDQPLTFVNDAFCRLTGYERAACVGRNCRFLQGEFTSRESVERVRRGIDEQRFTLTVLANYRHDGEAFDNALLIGPMRDEHGGLLRLFGMQWNLDRTLARRREAGSEGWPRSDLRLDRFAALVDRIATLSSEQGHGADGIAVIERLIAVSRPQQYPPEKRLPNWTRANALFEYLLDPYRFMLPNVVRVSGETGIVAADVAIPMAMAVHELAMHTLRLAKGDGMVDTIELHGEATTEHGEPVLKLHWRSRCPTGGTLPAPSDDFAIVRAVAEHTGSRFEHGLDGGCLQATVTVPNRPWQESGGPVKE